MHLVFDRGTLLLKDVPAGLNVAEFPAVLWDARVGGFRAPARVAYPLAAGLRRLGVALSDAPCPGLRPPSGFRAAVSLRPYQEAALSAWRRAGRRGVVVLPTGAGKTQVALAAMAATRTPCLCLVPTRALLAQWTKALAAVYDGPVGRFGDGLRVLAPVTIATFASAYRHMPVLGDRFGLLIVDEAHHFGHGVFDEALEMAIAPLRLGLTATPSAPGPAADRLTTLLGPVVFELCLADLGGEFLAPLRRITWRMQLDPDERREYDALTAVYRRALSTFRGNHLASGWEDFVRHAARTDEGRVGIAAWRRAARLLAFPRAKQEAVALLLARHRGQRTLVFVANNQTAYAVARENLIMPLTCDIGRAEREQALARFRSGQLRALVSAQVLNEGVDVPDAEVGIVVAGRLGEREHVQRVGRLLRPAAGKQALIYELVVSRSSEVGQAEEEEPALLSEADLPLRLVDRGAYFDFLGPQDEPWLRVLLSELVRFEGRRRRELAERLAEPLPCQAPYFKRRAATRVLLRLWGRERVAAVPPAEARARLFAAAAASASSADPPPAVTSVTAAVAAELGVGADALTESLFADLPGERVVRAPDPVPGAAEIVLRTNLAVVQATLMRASTINLQVEGGVRPIVRLAKLRGLLCTVATPTPAAGGGAAMGGEPVLQLSGPFALFQHTLLYGRALAELVPHLAWCARFQLRAACLLRGRLCDVTIESGAPIFPAVAPAPFDSRLEERFARDIARLAPDWDLIREPEAVPAGTTLIFPDFVLRHRIHTERRVMIELAGFWTPEYLAAKVDRLRQARLPPFILCVDERRGCGDGEIPEGLGAVVVRFRGRVDAAAVMRQVERLAAAAVTNVMTLRESKTLPTFE